MFVFAAEGGEEHNPILPIWQEVVIGTIAFAILCYVLMKYVFPRMEQTFKARVEAIEGGIKRAEVAQAEANQLLEQYRAQLAEARTDAARIRDDARADAEGIRQDVLAKAREESDRIIEAGKSSLAAERQTIVRELRAEVGTLAVDLASKIVGESLADEARRKGTVERFLTDLESAGGPLMQAASRESYAAVAERLEAHARRAAPATIAGTADDVLAVADLLRREPRLRRALSDPARSGEDRAALLRTLLGGKVGKAGLDLVSVLVAGRWSAPSELLEAAERLGVEALLASADRAGDLGEVEDELFRFGQVVSADPQLAGALGDIVAPPSQRAVLARDLLVGPASARSEGAPATEPRSHERKAGAARPVTVRLVEVALAGFGGRSFEGALIRLVELSADRRDRQVAYVTVAAPLTDEEERRLGAKLSELYGREVSVKQLVQPEILGGMSVLVGSDLYDGTVLRRLTDTRNALAKR